MTKKKVDKDKVASLAEEHSSETLSQETPSQSSTIQESASVQEPAGAVSPSTGTQGTRKRRERSDKGKPRGASRGGTVQVDPASICPKAVADAINRMPYTFMARRRGDYWNLSQEEVDNATPILQAVIAKYIPEAITKHSELYSLLMIHGMALWLRMEFEANLKREEAERENISGDDKRDTSGNAGGINGSGANAPIPTQEKTGLHTVRTQPHDVPSFSSIGHKDTPDKVG